ncbi:MAG: HigA family addiction module antitoxin [Vulcanimicrobiaceae bacterium]
MATRLAPVHPGEILFEDYMKPLKLSANRLALDLHVPANRILAIVKGKRAISAETALRLAHYFENTSAGFWVNLQAHYDLEVATDELDKTIAHEVRACARAS